MYYLFTMEVTTEDGDYQELERCYWFEKKMSGAQFTDCLEEMYQKSVDEYGEVDVIEIDYEIISEEEVDALGLDVF